MTDTSSQASEGIIVAIERTGNRLPDAVFIFTWLIVILMVASTVAAIFNLSAIHPDTEQPVAAKSLFWPGNLRELLAEMPAGFNVPLGPVVELNLAHQKERPRCLSGSAVL